jgi:hypothetical protein
MNYCGKINRAPRLGIKRQPITVVALLNLFISLNLPLLLPYLIAKIWLVLAKLLP